MRDMGDWVRPQIARFLSLTSAKTALRLEPAMERAIEVLEGISPAVMVPTAGGLSVAYGPQVHGFGFNLVAATPNVGVVIGLSDYGEVPDGVPDHVPASLWAALVGFIEEQSDAGHIVTAVKIRLGEAGIATVRKHMTKASEEGLTPFLLVLAASDGKQAAGVAGVIVLPASLERQISEIDGG